MRFVVQRERAHGISAASDRDLRSKLCLDELSGPIAFLHRARCIVPVIEDRDAVDRAEMQVPEHVARGQACDEQFLGIIARRVSVKCRIARALDTGLTVRGNHEVSRVAAIGFCPLAIGSPLNAGLVPVSPHARMIARQASVAPSKKAGRCE